MIRFLAAVCVVLVGVAFCVPAVAQDLRVQFGTENLEAVRSIQRGLQASSAGKHKDATAAFQDAIRLDSACGFAYFQLAIAQGLLGDLDESIATYKKVFTVGAGCGASIRSVAATNLGLILAQLGNSDEANRWFTRAILEDHQNQFKERGKSYRNLSLSLQSQKRPLAAALAVAMAYEDKARNCDIEMVREFFRRIGNSEVARVLHLDDEPAALKYRGEAATLEPLDLEGRIVEQVREMLPDPQGKYVAAMPASGSHYYLIRLGDASIVQKIESAPTLGACLVEGSLYVSRTNPDRIDQVDVETGKTLKTYAFGKPAPSSFAVFPAHNRIYFPSERIVHQFDMKSGIITETNVPGQAVCGHPTQQFVFSYIKPERDSRSSYVVIDGRLFQVDRGFDWIQSTLFKSIVTPSGLLLAQARDNVASNGSRLVLGQDGNWAAVVGGGGYRPTDKSSKGGYGVALFDSRTFEKLQGFYPTEAYPTGCCVNPVTGSVVTIRDADFRCYAMNSPDAGKVHAGKWNGVSTWSGDGRILLVGGKEGGVAAFGTKLTKEEEALASKWPESIKVAKLVGSDSPLRLDAEPIAALKDFGVQDKVIAEDVRKALQSAIANGRMARTVH